MKKILISTLLVVISVTTSFDLVYGQVDVTNCLQEMDEALQTYYDAIDDLRNCNINDALAKAEKIYDTSEYVINTCEDLPNGNAIGAASLNIVEAADSLRAGHSTSIPDPIDEHLITLNSCSILPTGEKTNNENTSSEDIKSWFDYTIDGAEINSIIPNTVLFPSLIISMNAYDDGILDITLPRSYIESKVGEDDDFFFVTVDGEEVDYEETTTTDDERRLLIEFPAGSSEIEIIGTFVIPEFGSIVMVVMTLGFLSIIFARFQKNIFKI